MIWASVWNFGLWVMLRSYVVMSMSRQAPQDARSKVGPRHRLGSHKFTVTVDIFLKMIRKTINWNRWNREEPERSSKTVYTKEGDLKLEMLSGKDD